MIVKNLIDLFVGLFALTFLCSFGLTHGKAVENSYDEKAAKIYLEKINNEFQEKMTESVIASWAYESNITDENLKNQLEVSAKLANFTKNYWLETIKFPWKTFQDPDIRRQFEKHSVLGAAILPPAKYERYNKVVSTMQSIYGKAKVCAYKNRTDCDLQLEPELTEIFAKSRDPDELSYYWEQWRNAAGKPVKELFKEYVELSNETAVLNNFTDNSEFWLKDYEAPDFKEQVEELWTQVKPLYLQLHAYVRRRLREFYGADRVSKSGPIPAHLLGNMWAQSWGNIFDLSIPYPGKPKIDITANMVEQGYTPLKMFKLAEEFFTSLNLSPMPDTFWRNSILEKPNDGRDLICHASAWDFYDGKDFRIKQCTRVTFKQLVTVHHEMGHIQYYIQYKNQPKVYKRGANPGFHEAVGDVMALSVTTPKHLRRIGLLTETEDDEESEINQLFNMALDKVAFLPFGYLMDQYRWSVFQGKTTEENYNKKWWQLRELYQGLSPTVVRSEEDFDPGAKYHTVGNVPYIRYFVSFIIQFQFHRSLCIAAKEYDPLNPQLKPLHKCDIYQSKEAGALLKKMLEMGSSKPWPEAMEVITGSKHMDAQALLDYFATLKTWLEEENARTGEYIGWETSADAYQKSTDTDDDSIKDKQGKCKFAVAPIQKNKDKLFTTLRNIEDGNSYAEFVQQDDNSFGVPDYLEETKPSYHILRESSKERYEETVVPSAPAPGNEDKAEPLEENKSTQKPTSHSAKTGYEEILVSQSCDEDRVTTPVPCNKEKTAPLFCKQDKVVKLPCDYGKNLIKPETEKTNQDPCHPEKNKPKKEEKCKSSLCEIKLLQKNECEKKKPPPKKTCPATISNLKMQYNQPFKVRSKSDDQQRVKILNIILNDGYQVKNFKKGKLNLEENEGGYVHSHTPTTLFKRTSKSNSVGGFKNKKDDSPVLNKQTELKTVENPESDKNLKETNKIEEPNRQSVNLLMEAETIKNKAQQMLKNFNFSNYAKKYIDVNGSLKRGEEFSQLVSRPHKILHTEQIKCGNNFPFRENSKERTYDRIQFSDTGRNLKTASRKNDYNLEAQFRKRELTDKKVHDQIKKKKKRKTKRNTFDKNSFVVLIEKISDDFKNPGKVKKSYKEYHYSVRTPVVYNSIVISNSGKSNKSNDARYRRAEHPKTYRQVLRSEKEKTWRRRKRKKSGIARRGRMAIFMVNMSKPVRKKQVNINNILQYFGLTTPFVEYVFF